MESDATWHEPVADRPMSAQSLHKDSGFNTEAGTDRLLFLEGKSAAAVWAVNGSTNPASHSPAGRMVSLSLTHTHKHRTHTHTHTHKHTHLLPLETGGQSSKLKTHTCTHRQLSVINEVVTTVLSWFPLLKTFYSCFETTHTRTPCTPNTHTPTGFLSVAQQMAKLVIMVVICDQIWCRDVELSEDAVWMSSAMKLFFFCCCVWEQSETGWSGSLEMGVKQTSR